jgi:hypothetical protein
MAYQFLKRLVLPWTSWDAFYAHVIDGNGNLLVPSNKMTREQHEAFDYFDRIVWNLRKLLESFPMGKTKLARVVAALLVLKEDVTQITDRDVLRAKYMSYMSTAQKMLDETDSAVPTNTAGGGNVAGIGTGGEAFGMPPVYLPRRRSSKGRGILTGARQTGKIATRSIP